jgi:glycosyltransferase involved in cell wall biosynthesis
LFHDRAVEGIRDGVHVIRERSVVDTLRLYRDHDVVLTQLATRNRAMLLSRLAARPLVHLLRMGAVDPATAFGIPDLLVCNAAWLQQLKPWPGASTVLHPPVYADAYRTTPGAAITLINLNARKGGPTFFALAELLPDHQFLGVTGSWGDQMIPAKVPANVTIMGPVDDARDIYGRTRILLMPSSYEPYGRVSLEAAASGIPTIASQAEGIREALGDAGIYLPLDDIDRWAAAVVALDDPVAYEEASARALTRSHEMSPESELVEFESQLRALTPLCHASQSS